MKKIISLAIIFATIVLVSCEDDFEPLLTATFEAEEFAFDFEGGSETFELESNESWSINDLPDWIFVKVKDNGPTTRSTTYVKGKKEITIVVLKNEEYASREAELVFSSLSRKKIKVLIQQAQKPQLLGYWILSEGYAGQNNTELAWYDIAKGVLIKNQFLASNGTKLGDTGNDLQIYGSKMYCVVPGPGMGAAATEGTNYIEVINPANGKSIKRIPFTDAKGAAAKPRNIVFEDGKGYISSYSNEVVRLDTATLTLDAFATLSGTLAEGLAINDGKIYVCNSGHGADNKISVVDIDKMQEVKVITTAKNPTSIVSTAKGELFFNTNYPDYKLYKLTTEPENIEEIKNISASSLTFTNNSVYTCSFSWTTYKGYSDRYNLTTNKATPLNLDLKSHGIRLLMEYKIGAINDVDDIFISGMGDDIIIYDTITKEIKHTFNTGIPNGSGVVAYFKR